jgi:tetratricopeptide (TPR) repeat protein
MVAATRPAPSRRAPLDERRLHVVWLRGNSRQRGRQLGEELRSQREALDAQLRFWVEFVPAIARSHLPDASPRAWRNMVRLVERSLVAPIAKRLPTTYREGVKGFAAGLGHADLGPWAEGDLEHTVLRTHAMYDAVNVLSGLPLGRAAPASRLGCSSLVALPAFTESGELIHGRNFDMPPIGDTLPPLVCVHLPDEGLPHVSLHHGGGFSPGITATNTAGLTVGVHQNYTRAVSVRGASVQALAMELVERCSSLSAALELLRARPTAGGWTFVISDAGAGRAAAVEIDADGASALYPPRQFLSVANCYRTSKDKKEFAFTGATREHNWCRLSRLNQLAREQAERHDAASIAAALGDHTDAYEPDRQRAYGNCVSALHNLDAVVCSPGLDGLWVASGKAPRNSADGYVGLRLSALFAGRTETLEPLEPTAPSDDFRSALDHAADAGQLLFRGEDAPAALDALERAAELDPSEPLHRFLCATLLLREGFALDAAELFGGCIDDETSPYRSGLAALMRGRALDVLGHRAEARSEYDRVEELAEDVDPNLVARARRSAARGFSPKQARGLVVDAIFGDVTN